MKNEMDEIREQCWPCTLVSHLLSLPLYHPLRIHLPVPLAIVLAMPTYHLPSLSAYKLCCKYLPTYLSLLIFSFSLFFPGHYGICESLY